MNPSLRCGQDNRNGGAAKQKGCELDRTTTRRANLKTLDPISLESKKWHISSNVKYRNASMTKDDAHRQHIDSPSVWIWPAKRTRQRMQQQDPDFGPLRGGGGRDWEPDSKPKASQLTRRMLSSADSPPFAGVSRAVSFADAHPSPHRALGATARSRLSLFRQC
jgi:hypothetical protein